MITDFKYDDGLSAQVATVRTAIILSQDDDADDPIELARYIVHTLNDRGFLK